MNLLKLMTKPNHPGRRARTAFTLIELIVVMAIITVLAALAFTAIKGIKESATRKKVRAELARLETAIESYKAKYNFYPPDNPGRPEFNQLYFELMGTEPFVDGPVTYFRTLDGGAKIPINGVSAIFGPNVSGFANHTQGNSDEGQPAENFFSKAGLPPTLIGSYQVGSSDIRLIVCSVQRPDNLQIIPGLPGVIPWCYNSSSPTNNPGSYDLWVDVIIGGKTNRISNWSDKPQIFK